MCVCPQDAFLKGLLVSTSPSYQSATSGTQRAAALQLALAEESPAGSGCWTQDCSQVTTSPKGPNYVLVVTTCGALAGTPRGDADEDQSGRVTTPQQFSVDPAQSGKVHCGASWGCVPSFRSFPLFLLLMLGWEVEISGMGNYFSHPSLTPSE